MLRPQSCHVVIGSQQSKAVVSTRHIQSDIVSKSDLKYADLGALVVYRRQKSCLHLEPAGPSCPGLAKAKKILDNLT